VKSGKHFEKEIWAYALKNALDFGNADVKAVLPKLFQHGLQKKEIYVVVDQVRGIVREVNKMTPEEIDEKWFSYKDIVVVHEKVEKGLGDLKGAGKGMVFRLAPYPSGDLHIGNAKTYILNALYAEKYKGKIILFMDDTIGSAEKPITPEAYDLIKDSLKWLGIKFEKKVYYKSDRLKIYYEYAEKLIEKGYAYVCSSTQADFKKYKDAKKDCPSRTREIDENLKLWKKMFKAKEGSMVLRLKTDMKHPNPAFRDRVLFKISDRKHARVGKKYRVWPSLDMSWAIDDHLIGTTHIIRGNDLMMETEMEKYIWDIFGWKYPVVVHSGLVRIEGLGANISKSKSQKEVKSGEFTGWDDPRTWSIQSLKRRGIRAEAIRAFVEKIGLNKQDINVPIEELYSIQRSMIDGETDRYSFVSEPVDLGILKSDVKETKVPVHPHKKKMRKVEVSEIFISGSDFRKFKGKEVRLIHLYNVKLGKKSKYTGDELKKVPKINWVSENVKASVLMPDGSSIGGIAESDIKKLKPGSVIQFERFGFVRFDGKKKDVYEFWFSHK